jgi:hypothetical protein
VTDEISDDSYAVPAPQKEDILFQYFHGFSLLEEKGLRQWAYHSAFILAAKRLAESARKTDQNANSLVYPIIYLYRHYFELVLKAIIEACHELLDRKPTKEESRQLIRHDLEKLWQIAQPLMDPVCLLTPEPPFPTEEMEGVASYIRQIHALDPDGQSFRYADTKGAGAHVSTTLIPKLKAENNEHLWAALEKLANYLECIEGWLTNVQEAKQEYELKFGK